VVKIVKIGIVTFVAISVEDSGLRHPVAANPSKYLETVLSKTNDRRPLMYSLRLD